MHYDLFGSPAWSSDDVRYIIGGLIVSTNLDGFSLANHGGFAKLMRLQKYAWHQDLVASAMLDLD